jgi:hypothetical protein
MKITIELSVNDLNKILAALGNQPYVQVFELIESLKQQAEPQLTQNDQPTSETK